MPIVVFVTIFLLCGGVCVPLPIYGQVATPPVLTTGPEQDVRGALPIVDSVFVQPNIYRGFGRTMDLGAASCLGVERNSVWYKVTPLTSGNLGFTLEPNIAADDFDWAVYRVPTGRAIADIASDPSLEISCNFSNTPGATGPNGRSTRNRQDSDGSPFNALIPVNAGETYYIVVNTATPAISGYRLNFSSSAPSLIGRTLAPSAAAAPRMMNFTVEQGTCSVESLALTFSEYVRCSGIQARDFIVLTPDSVRVAVAEVVSARCSRSPNNFDTTFTLTLAQPLTLTGIHTIFLNRPITTLSGATVQGSLSQMLQFPDLRPTIVSERGAAPSNGVFLVCSGGSVTLDAGGGFTNYSWSSTASVTTTSTVSSSPFSTARTITVNQPGRYVVTVRDKNGCSGQTTATVAWQADALSPTLWGFDYFCGTGSTLIGVANPERYASFRWSTGEATPFISVSQPGVYSVIVRDLGGCEGSASKRIERVNESTLAVNIGGSAQFCEGESTTLSASNEFFNEYQWFLNGMPVINATKPTLTVVQPGVYSLRIRINGCTVTSPSVTVRRNALPIAPVITQRGNVLLSSGGQMYQWLRASSLSTTATFTVVTGATASMFVPQQNGVYAVAITDANGCRAISAPIEVRRVEGQATLEVGSVSGEQGRTVEIPIFLRNARALEATGTSGFTGILRFSSQLLRPEDPRLRDSVVAGEYFVRVNLPAQPIDASGLLDKYRFTLVFGSTSSTVVALQNASAVPQGVGVTVATVAGVASLRGRFILTTTSIVSVEAYPNPVLSGAAELQYELAAADVISITLTNALGAPVKTLLVGKEMPQGKHSLPIPTDDLQTGTYFIHVRTLSHTVQARMTILR
jgi:hypothetical protein